MVATMTAAEATSYQRCERLYQFQRNYRPLKWHPKALFDACLRRAILTQSGAAEAVAQFLGVCAAPGIEAADPYVLAHDFAACLRTILEATSRLSLPKVKPGPKVGDWQCTAFMDDDGILHRWATVERLDSDALSRELHSWHVYGDTAAAQTSMMLHVVEIGRRSGSHQVTPWCRAWKHPRIINQYRFQKLDGSRLGEGWIPWWFQDNEKNDPKAWVDLMEADGLKLIHHIPVKQPGGKFDHPRPEPKDPFTILMNRAACDAPYPCQFQPACFTSEPVDLEALGLYRKV